MDADRFKQLVARLETQSATAPGSYRLKVAALALLGFAILALLFATVGFGLVLLAGLVLAILFSGGSFLLLLVKLGKVLIFLAIPMWYLMRSGVKALFVRLPAPQGREVTRSDAPVLFASLDRMQMQMKGPSFHHVLIVDDVNAAALQRPAFGLIGWPRNYLLLGLPLLESLPPEEALAVVAHEYGHLAGSHGRFAAFIYRLRHSWGTVQAYTDHIQGWLGRLVAPLIRWYAPYFNAYTFVLARDDEYRADAASAHLVGVGPATNALKRVNLVAPRHQRFMQKTYGRIATETSPPPDVMLRWADEAVAPVPGADAEHWLGMALDRAGHFTDSHPTLRARLAALAPAGEQVQDPPPPLNGPTAAEAWLGPMTPALRAEFQALWSAQVASLWAEGHAQAKQQRQRLAALRALKTRSADETIELLNLQLNLEPESDLRTALATFNAEHADQVLGLFLEGKVRLDRGEREGLVLLDRACALDPSAIKPACEAAHVFLLAQRDSVAAEVYAERWRERDALESRCRHQLQNLDGKDAFTTHALNSIQLSAIRGLLSDEVRAHIAEVYLARRLIPADPGLVQHVLGVRLTLGGRWRGKQREVVDRLAELAWPVPLVFVSLDGRLAPWLKQFRLLAGSRVA